MKSGAIGCAKYVGVLAETEKRAPPYRSARRNDASFSHPALALETGLPKQHPSENSTQSARSLECSSYLMHLQVDVGGVKNTFASEEISAMMLARMKEIAEGFLGQEVLQAVIAVPTYFNDAQRRATHVCTYSGHDVRRLACAFGASTCDRCFAR